MMPDVVTATSALTVDDVLRLYDAALTPLELIISSGVTIITAIVGVLGRLMVARLKTLTDETKQIEQSFRQLAEVVRQNTSVTQAHVERFSQIDAALVRNDQDHAQISGKVDKILNNGGGHVVYRK